MKRTRVLKTITIIMLLILAIVMGKLSIKTSLGADDKESAILEGAFDKYINYQTDNGNQGTLVQYSIRTGIDYSESFDSIKNTELNVFLKPIDGKYPYDVKVIAKSTKVTNGKTYNINDDYTYDAMTGKLTIRANNENEKGEPIYNTKPEKNDRDEFVIISYYDAFTTNKTERDIECDITYKAVLFTDNREVTAQGQLQQKVTENIGELTSISTNTSDVYNGYMKSNIINGTNYDTEYTENSEIVISKKEAHQKINISEENTFINTNDVYYKNTKILKEDILNVLGENGKIEIVDANNNIIETIDNNSTFNENGEYIVNYEDEIKSISIKTSDIVNEGILHIENVKKIKGDLSNLDDKDIVTKTNIVGIKEKQETTDESNTAESYSTEQQDKTIEECYRNEQENKIEIKNSKTNVDVDVSETEWTNEKQNEVNFDIVLNSSTIENNLFNNPTIKIKLPSGIEKVVLKESDILYANGLNMEKPYVKKEKDGSTYIIVKLQGQQAGYNENNLELKTNVKIYASIILNKEIESKSDQITVSYTNSYTADGSTEQGDIKKAIKITNFKETQSQENNSTETENSKDNIIDKITEIVEEKTQQELGTSQQDIEGLKVTVTPIKGDKELKDGDTVYSGEFIKYNVKITNTTDKSIDDIKITGTIPDGTKYGELEADYYTVSGRYEYNFDETIKEKEIKVGTIKPGETITKYYEVQVKDLSEGETELEIQTNIKMSAGTTEFFDYNIKNVIKPSNVKVFVRAKLDYTKDKWNYEVEVEGLNSQTATIKLKAPSSFSLWYVVKGTDFVPEDEVTVGEDNVISMNVSESSMYSFQGIINAREEGTTKGEMEITASATVTTNDIEYTSNENRIIYGFENFSVQMSSENEGEEIKYEDEINYDISVTNIGRTNYPDQAYNSITVNLSDYLPEQVEPISVTYENYDIDETTGKLSSEKETKTESISFTTTDEDGNKLPNVNLTLQIPYKETLKIQVKVKAGHVYEKTSIENRGIVELLDGNQTVETKETNVIKHVILPYNYSEEPDKPVEPEDPDKPVDPEDPDTPTQPDEGLAISGLAWNDANGDGKRQSEEGLIDGITVMLVNLEDSSNIVSSTTTSNGKYKFNDLEKGNYIVVFKYDTSRYSITQYNTNGISEEENCDATEQTIVLDGQKIDVGITDEIKLNQEANNIDIGLIEKGGYDLKLEKYITEILVATQKGTKQISYDNTKLGRVEISAKEVNGAEVSVKYKIVITNEGQSAAKVSEIYDYIPEGLNFSVQGNTNWIKKDNLLVNKGLMNQEINPGESKEVSLILTKTMTGENTGTYTNIAEIGKAEGSIKGTKDTDSTPGNNSVSEDDYSKADLIIGISTGAVIYISIGVIGAIGLLILIGIKCKFKIKKISKIGLSITLFIVVGIVSCNDAFAEMAAPSSTWFTQIRYCHKGHTYKQPVGGDTSVYICDKCAANGVSEHYYLSRIFEGGPQGEGGYCITAGVWAHTGTHSYKTYSRTSSTGNQIIQSDDVTINLRNLNKYEQIGVRKVGSRYILGPFKVAADYNGRLTIDVYNKSGRIVSGYTTCNANGNSMTATGTSTFYLSTSSSNYESGGVSKVKASMSRSGTITTESKVYGYAIYSYPERQDVRTNNTYLVDYQRNVQKIYNSESVEWTNFKAALDLIKVDKDDYGTTINIEGTLRKNDGTFYDSFRTTNGRYHWDNLQPGYYTLTETVNNNYGYEDNVRIQKTVFVNGGTVETCYLENTKYTGNLKIVKKDKDNGQLMSGVSFKLKGTKGYVIGVDDRGNSISKAVGRVHFSNMRYTSNKGQATEFVTDSNGVVEILNIRIGSYTVTETAINTNKYGYELDNNYIFWSSNTASGKGDTGQVEVVRRKSYVTKSNNQTLRNSDYDTILFENRRKWVKLSGNVWEDKISGKTSQRDYIYTSGGTTENNPDKLLKNVTVKLKDKNSNTIKETMTNANGHYLMTDILIDRISSYYVEFSYNGMSYQSVPVIEMLLNNQKGGTKAIENVNKRAEFNKKYSEITHSGTTGPRGESKDENGRKTYNLKYDTNQKYDGSEQIKSTLNYGSKSLYGYEGQEFPINNTDEQYMITASTKDAYLSVAGNSGYLDDMYTSEEIRLQAIEEIQNIDLGVYEREQPDLSLIEDIEKVSVHLNGYEHTYNYNQRFEDQNKDGFNVGVKFENEYGSAQYTQAIYPSDVVYNQGHNNNLAVYVRYKIALRNEGTNVYTKVNEIVNYFDSKYDIADDEYVAEGVTDEEGKPLEYIEEKYNNDFKKITIQTDQKLEYQKTKNIYITYKLQDSVVNDLLNNIPPLESVSEITSYSTYSDSNFSIHYAGVDKDSRPGSAELGNKTSYEDDTDKAPGFVLEAQESRVIQGTVWEDKEVSNFLNKNEERKERIGNGIYDEGEENMVKDVKVELIALSYDADSNVDLSSNNILEEINGVEPEIALLYKQGNTKGEKAITTTDENGNYEFSGVIPGKYLLRFTYGNDSIIVKADGSGNEKIEDVDKYKSTIYRKGDKDAAEAMTDYWYRAETGDESTRLSDARDEIGINGNGKFDLLKNRFDTTKEYYYGNSGLEEAKENPESVTSIESRSRGFEIKMDYDIKLDNMSTYEDQTTGKIKFIFDNMDFGIIRRPMMKMNVEKKVAYVQLKLANGQVIIEGNLEENPKQNIEHLKVLPDGNVHIELDSELIQGATLTIRYQFIANNSDSEIDYNDEDYYIFGKTPPDDSKLVVPRIKRLVDYLSNELTIKEMQGWELCDKEELHKWHDNDDNKKYLSDDAYKASQKFNQILQTNKFANMGLGEKNDVYLEVSRVLANDVDDLIFENDIEVNILTGGRTTTDNNDKEYTIPGNYIPSNGEPGGDDDYRSVVITGPTGENKNYIQYILLGMSMFIVLGTGIIIIKKKVL